MDLEPGEWVNSSETRGPGAVAKFDQEQALAIKLIKNTHTFLLAYIDGNHLKIQSAVGLEEDGVRSFFEEIIEGIEKMI